MAIGILFLEVGKGSEGEVAAGSDESLGGQMMGSVFMR